MELLETALKHSFAWSLDKQRAATSKPQSDKITKAIMSDVADCIEFVNMKSQNESQVRAFVTRFKIELNQLMGLKCSEPSVRKNADDSMSNEREFASPKGRANRRTQASRKFVEPTIKLSGKYSGVYNLSGQQSDDDDDGEVDDDDDEDYDSITTEEAYSRHMQLVYGVPKDSLVNARDQTDQVDDGYRSLSRDSVTSKKDSRPDTTGRVVELLKQLNDIKSRVIDLVQELDQTVGPKLSEEDLEAYRRRCDALVSKLDALIESQKPVVSSSDSSNKMHDKNLARDCQIRAHRLTTTTSGDSSSASDYYEEQVQVIDYDFNRRASDLSEIKRHNRLTTDSHTLDLSDQKAPPALSSSSPSSSPSSSTTTTTKSEAIINNEHNTTTQIDLSRSNNHESRNRFPPPVMIDTSVRRLNTQPPIDFGAMMRDYALNKMHQQQVGMKKGNQNHLPSSSSVSAHSSGSSSFI